MIRVLKPEILDHLPADDPAARHSRRDLQRVNGWMGHARLISHTLMAEPKAPGTRWVELGAGDGTLALAVARRLHRRFPKVELTMVDQQSIVTQETLDGFQSLGWRTSVVKSDVFDWFEKGPSHTDVITMNLFLHHFEGDALKELLAGVAAKSRQFVAMEPRRGWWPKLGCLGLGLIGCNAVTRHDARVSVVAGFRASELTALWPADGGWRIQERSAGVFSHLFHAVRHVS